MAHILIYIHGAHLGISNLLPDLVFHKRGSGLKESPHSRDCFEGGVVLGSHHYMMGMANN